MQRIMWVCVFVILGLLAAPQSFARTHPLEGQLGHGETDHRVLAMMFDEEAEANKAKAENWEFIADYYEKFPSEFSGTKMTVTEHIAHCRSIADDYRKAEKYNRDLAAKHRQFIRRGP